MFELIKNLKDLTKLYLEFSVEVNKNNLNYYLKDESLSSFIIDNLEKGKMWYLRYVIDNIVYYINIFKSIELDAADLNTKLNIILYLWFRPTFDWLGFIWYMYNFFICYCTIFFNLVSKVICFILSWCYEKNHELHYRYLLLQWYNYIGYIQYGISFLWNTALFIYFFMSVKLAATINFFLGLSIPQIFLKKKEYDFFFGRTDYSEFSGTVLIIFEYFVKDQLIKIYPEHIRFFFKDNVDRLSFDTVFLTEFFNKFDYRYQPFKIYTLKGVYTLVTTLSLMNYYAQYIIYKLTKLGILIAIKLSYLIDFIFF